MYTTFLPFRRWLVLLLVTTGFACSFTNSIAQSIDTLQLGLPEIDKRFLDSNLFLLAAHYNADAQKALIQQAKLWDNPVLNTDQVIAANGKIFPYGKFPDGSYSGQYYVQIQQLIKTAGKRSKLVTLATTNSKLSELQLQDVLRTLRYQLHTDFYTILQQLENRAIYQNRLQQINKLLTAMEAQLSTGNIAQKDYLRIQALVISLQQDMTELDRSIADIQSDIKTLLQIKNNDFIKPVQANPLGDETVKLVDTGLLFETGKQHNPSYLLQQTQSVFQQQNLVYQKSLRIPDLMLGPNFDRNSNFASNYVGLGISLPLPVFNRNQGNIKSAEYTVKQQQSLGAAAETELKNNISNAYNKFLLIEKQNTSVQKDFYIKYQSMYRNILASYQQRQISLLDFLDFFTDYTQTQQKLIMQRLNLQLAKEELNYQVGADVFQQKK